MSVLTASNCTVNGTSKGNLPIPQLSPTASECHRIPTIQSPLFSIGQACDDECIAIFTNKEVTISKANDISISHNEEPLIKGHQADNKLWHVPVPEQPTHAANSAHTQSNAKKLATFLHTCAGCPQIQSFCKETPWSGFVPGGAPKEFGPRRRAEGAPTKTTQLSG